MAILTQNIIIVGIAGNDLFCLTVCLTVSKQVLWEFLKFSSESETVSHGIFLWKTSPIQIVLSICSSGFF
jgi:hypothetical protein